MLALGLELHQIDDIDHTDFQIGQMLTKDGNSSQNLQSGCVSAAAHYYIRLCVLGVAGPLPDANSFCAMHNSSIHSQPLREGMFACNHYIDVVPAAQAMIKYGQEAVGIRR